MLLYLNKSEHDKPILESGEWKCRPIRLDSVHTACNIMGFYLGSKLENEIYLKKKHKKRFSAKLYVDWA